MTNNPPKINIERLKDALPITELAERLGIKLNRSKQALCIFHNEKTPSLSFSDDKKIFTCFSCNKHGDIIDLYKEVKGLTTGEAIKELAGMAGLAPANQQSQPQAKKLVSKLLHQNLKPEPAETYSDIYEELVYLCGGLDKESIKYLTGVTRGLTEDTLNRFLLCSITDYAEVDKQLKAKFSITELQQAGVLSEKNSLIFYKHKIIIPFLRDGRIVFLQGRRLDDGQPKYLFIKRPVPLFNPDTLGGLEKGDRIYICEGVFDAMILEQNGYKAVAILGVNNFKPEYTELFKGFEVVLCLDNDEPAKQAIDRLAKMFLLKGQAVIAKQLPDGIKDITEYFLTTKQVKSKLK